jgi:hypothetical protein
MLTPGKSDYRTVARDSLEVRFSDLKPARGRIREKEVSLPR